MFTSLPAPGLSDRKFGRGRRLLTPAQYSAVFDSRQSVRKGVFVLHYRRETVQEDEALRPSRLGLVIPKKNARRAVWRNVIKRQIRESFRHCAGLSANIDVVARLAQALPGSACDTVLRRTIRQEIDDLFCLLAKRCSPPPALPVSAPALSP